MRAKKSLGQNFLRDTSIVAKIIDALDIGDDETVIEIGPGQGALTEGLLEKAKSVIAIEFDRDMVSFLSEHLGKFSNFHLVNDDALNVDFEQVLRTCRTEGRVKLVANLPYNISTAILQRLIDQRFLFTSLVLMFQKDVVGRITARPGKKDRGYLSVLVEDAFETETLFDVPPTAFYPVPKVWSSVVRLQPKESLISDHAFFKKVMSASFSQKRKTILNNLNARFIDAASILDRVGIDKQRRAETLTLDEWETLTEAIDKQK